VEGASSFPTDMMSFSLSWKKDLASPGAFRGRGESGDVCCMEEGKDVSSQCSLAGSWRDACSDSDGMGLKRRWGGASMKEEDEDVSKFSLPGEACADGDGVVLERWSTVCMDEDEDVSECSLPGEACADGDGAVLERWSGVCMEEDEDASHCSLTNSWRDACMDNDGMGLESSGVCMEEEEAE